MPVELLLIRHGESEGNAGLPCEIDCSLTPNGLDQSRRVARQLLDHDLNGFVGLTSPYKRAIQTAAEITKITGLSFAVDEAVREFGGPVTINGKHYPAEKGEQLTERLKKFLRQHEGEKLVVVSHAAPIAVLLHLAGDETPGTAGEFWAGIDNCCLRRVVTTD